MQNKFRCLCTVALVMLWSLFSGCAYLSAPQAPFHHDQGSESNYFEKVIKECSKTNVTCELAKDSALTVMRFDSKHETGKTDKDEDVKKAKTLLRFVWLSDVHIPQRDIRLYSPEISHALAEVNPCFEYNEAQEDFHWAVYLSQIKAINALNRDRETPVDFMIHTGDCVLRGSLEELYQFIYISNKLDIPWLNVVGNHDISLFGNYKERLGYGADPNVIFYPIGELGNFVWMHRSFCSEGETQITSPQGGRKYCHSGYGRHLLPVPANLEHGPSINPKQGAKLVPTFHHGFDLDLGITCGTEPSEVLSKKLSYDRTLGDYATDLCGITSPLRIRLIVLNSAKKDAFGASSDVTKGQLEWLKNKALLKDSGVINLVFQHHPVKENSEVKAVLADSGNATVVVFTGHVHPKSKYDITWNPGDKGGGFYELNTGAVLEYPQIAQLIELRGEPGKRVWLISRALWSSLMTVDDEERMPTKDERNTFLTACIRVPKDSDNREVREAILKAREDRQKYLPVAVRCGHLGAYDDYEANKLRGQTRPQFTPTEFKEIWHNVNTITEITPHWDEVKKEK